MSLEHHDGKHLHRLAAPPPPYLNDILRRQPTNWEDPKVRVTLSVLEQAGVISLMARRTPELTSRLAEFFVGDKRILVVGGESGMGKSLIGADIQQVHQDLEYLLPPELHHPLDVVTYDREHKAFFDVLSSNTGVSVPLPRGETHPKVRTILSRSLTHIIRFNQDFPERGNRRLLIEAPLIDKRGETIFDDLGSVKDQVQTLIMHSPATRDETLREGRMAETSGQPQAMSEMRVKFLERVMGDSYKHISSEAQDDVIRRWWAEKLAQWNGTIVQWDPNDDRSKYVDTTTRFKQSGRQPDRIIPPHLSRYTSRLLESVLESIPDMEAFLKEVSAA